VLLDLRSIFDRPSSTLDSQRRRQDSNLHRNSPGGLARRCHTIRRRLQDRELRIEDRGSNDETRSRSSLSSILHPRPSVLWRRVRDSNSHRPKPAGFRDRCTASYANPPRSRSRRIRTSINGFGDRHAAGYTMLPWSHRLPGSAGVPPAWLVNIRKRAGGTACAPRKVDAKSMLSEGIEPPMTARVA
jgi:hypothetical protein